MCFLKCYFHLLPIFCCTMYLSRYIFNLYISFPPLLLLLFCMFFSVFKSSRPKKNDFEIPEKTIKQFNILDKYCFNEIESVRKNFHI